MKITCFVNFQLFQCASYRDIWLAGCIGLTSLVLNLILPPLKLSVFYQTTFVLVFQSIPNVDYAFLWLLTHLDLL